MTWESWLAFISTSLVVCFIPGPDMILIAGWSATKGFKAGFKALVGMVLGVVVHSFAAAMGLAALLATSAVAFAAIKYIGALYLIYLGVMILRKKETKPFKLTTLQKTPNPFLQGFLTDVLNPKVVIFFLAFLPQFVQPGPGASMQLLALGLSFALLSACCYLVLIALVSKAGQKMGQNERVRTLAKWLGGFLFIGFGLRLALASRI